MRTAEQKHKAKMALDDIRQKMAEKAAGTIGPKRSRDEVDEEVPAGKRQKMLGEPSSSTSKPRVSNVGNRPREEVDERPSADKLQKTSDQPISSATHTRGVKRSSDPKEVAQPHSKRAKNDESSSETTYMGTAQISSWSRDGARIVRRNTSKTAKQIEKSCLRTDRRRNPALVKPRSVTGSHSEEKLAAVEKPSSNAQPDRQEAPVKKVAKHTIATKDSNPLFFAALKAPHNKITPKIINDSTANSTTANERSVATTIADELTPKNGKGQGDKNDAKIVATPNTTPKPSSRTSIRTGVHQDGNYESGPPKALQSGDTQQPAKFSQGNHRSAALAEKDLNKKVQKRSASEAFDIDDNDRPSKRLQPVGLYNHYYACFANAVLQCLHGAGPLSSHYGPKASGVLQGVANCGVTEKDFKQFTAGRRATREDTRKKDTVRGALHRATQAIPILAYTGEVFQRMASSSSEKSISPFLLQQAYAELRPGFDGETSQDAHQFLTEYLTILEQNEMKEDQVASEETVVRRTFGGETTTQFCCSACGHKYETVADFLCLDVDVSSRDKTSLGACLNTLPRRETIDDYKCSDIRRNGKDRGCGKVGKVEKTTYLKEELEYLAVHLARMVGTDKRQTKVTFPTEAIDLSHLTGPNPALRQEALNYEVIGIVEHKGTPSKGHYTAVRKEHGAWWHINDAKVQEMSEEKVKVHQNGYLFFLRKIPQGDPDPEDENGDMIQAKPDTQGQSVQGDQDPKEGDGGYECPPTPRNYESI